MLCCDLFRGQQVYSLRRWRELAQICAQLLSDGATTAMNSMKSIPSELSSAISENFGSIDKFKEEFCAAGAGQFGAGWCWLVKDTDGSLKVTKTENGVNPLCFGQSALLGCDVWEHSYYIDFRNKRPAYLTNFLDKLVNWENVAARM